MLTLNVLIYVCLICPAFSSTEHQKKATVSISVKGATGQGVVIKNGRFGEVLTARHVISNADTTTNITVTFSDGSTANSTAYLYIDDRHDQAKIYIVVPESIPALQIGDPPKVGDWVMVHRKKHHVWCQVDFMDRNIFCCPDDVTKGDSGGPVCDKHGQVVGVIVAGWIFHEGSHSDLWPTLIGRTK